MHLLSDPVDSTVSYSVVHFVFECLSQPQYTTKQWLEIFPDARTEVIPNVLNELIKNKELLIETITKKLQTLKDKSPNYKTYYFWKSWIKLTDGKELADLNFRIEELKRLTFVSKPVGKQEFTQPSYKTALTIPVQSIIPQNLIKRITNKHITCICPLPSHKDTKPSFVVYLHSNSFYCFGCNTGGNVVTLATHLFGMNWKQATNHLIANYHG